VFQIVPLSEAPKRMSCEEKARLVKEYDDATLAFSDAVQELRRRIGTPPKVEYERLERISSAARVKSEVAEEFRLALVPRKRRPDPWDQGECPGYQREKLTTATLNRGSSVLIPQTGMG
jgi:hypothetical protein